MTREHDRWRMPALDRLGAQLREAERAALKAPTRSRKRRPCRLSARSAAAAVIAALAAAGAVLEIVAPAGALSPVNRAPLAAERSRSVRFTSAQTITLNGRRVTRVTETGALDFATGEFATTLIVGETSERIERRRVGATFYIEQVSEDATRARRTRWSAISVGRKNLRSFSLPGGYSLIDPEVLFRVMANARTPVAFIGHQTVDGKQTTQYRLATTLDAFSAAARDRPIRGSAPNDVLATLDVWLDAKGRPVRAQATFSGRSRFGTATMTTVVDFTAYGAAVVVEAPPRLAISPRGIRTLPSAIGDPARVVERLLFPPP